MARLNFVFQSVIYLKSFNLTNKSSAFDIPVHKQPLGNESESSAPPSPEPPQGALLPLRVPLGGRAGQRVSSSSASQPVTEWVSHFLSCGLGLGSPGSWAPGREGPGNTPPHGILRPKRAGRAAGTAQPRIRTRPGPGPPRHFGSACLSLGAGHLPTDQGPAPEVAMGGQSPPSVPAPR